MRPLRAVAAQLPLLVVHALVQVLDQLQADDAVVRAARVTEQGTAELAGPRE